MRKFRYVGTISPVSMKGKGVVKRGDIVNFKDEEIVGLSSENWQEVSIPTFKKEVDAFSKHTGKRIFRQPKIKNKGGENNDTT